MAKENKPDLWDLECQVLDATIDYYRELLKRDPIESRVGRTVWVEYRIEVADKLAHLNQLIGQMVAALVATDFQ